LGKGNLGKLCIGDIHGSHRATPPADAVKSRNLGGVVVVTGPGQIFTQLAQASGVTLPKCDEMPWVYLRQCASRVLREM
jgi:hypothetical protein